MKELIDDLHSWTLKTTGTIQQSLTLVRLLSFVIIGLSVTVFYMEFSKPTPEYFSRSKGGVIKKINPIGAVNISTRNLLNWSMVAVTNLYTLDFLNYESFLRKSGEFFTKTGYDRFLASLKLSGRLDDIVSNKLIASAVVVDSPIILREGMVAKEYIWEVQLPIAISYQGPSKEVYKQWLAVNLLIKKVPTSEAIKGIGIENISDASMAPLY